MNALKLFAARGKLAAALAWIHDFCSSGERLVVFAHHREIQRAVLGRFPSALHILGEDSHAARDAALRAFQGPDGPENQLVVCSIEVAGQGLTLTRSSNVVFLELDWTPAKHDQAEDRCHRIGQKDLVNASYILAAGTIDETISTLLERKRAVIGAVTDGRQEDEGGVVDALVRELEERALPAPARSRVTGASRNHHSFPLERGSILPARGQRSVPASRRSAQCCCSTADGRASRSRRAQPCPLGSLGRRIRGAGPSNWASDEPAGESGVSPKPRSDCCRQTWPASMRSSSAAAPDMCRPGSRGAERDRWESTTPRRSWRRRSACSGSSGSSSRFCSATRRKSRFPTRLRPRDLRVRREHLV